MFWRHDLGAKHVSKMAMRIVGKNVRSLGMRPVLLLICLALACAVIPADSAGQGMPTTPAVTDQAQWGSHQMNQPPPQKPPLSEERIEDIRKLYLQAREEIEKAKAVDPQKNPSSK